MPNSERDAAGLSVIEVKAFVPAKDYEVSKQFYLDLGFSCRWAAEDLAYFHHGSASFLLQNFYVQDHADNFMMHLLVTDADAWWARIQAQGLVQKYGVRAEPPEDRPWQMRDFVLIDPTGVLWRIGHNLPQRSFD